MRITSRRTVTFGTGPLKCPDRTWQSCLARVAGRAFLALTASLVLSATEGVSAPTSKTANVLVINFDPVLTSRGGVKLHEYFKWSDPWKLTEAMIEDAKVSSGGFVQYRVLEKIDYNGFPKFRDGFTYSEANFLRMWEKDRGSANKSMTSFQWLFAPNSQSDYDWSRTNLVWTYADDWLEYPKLARKKKLLNAQSGGWDGIRNHHLWWMARLPHADGAKDGFYNNWWQYIVNYDDAVKKLPPPDASFEKARTAMYAP